MTEGNKVSSLLRSARAAFVLSGISFLSVSTILLGLVLTGFMIQLGDGYAGVSFLLNGQLALPVRPFMFLAPLVLIFSSVCCLTWRSIYARAEMLCVVFVLLLAPLMMTEGFWSCVVKGLASIPDNSDMAKFDGFSGKIWTHIDNVDEDMHLDQREKIGQSSAAQVLQQPKLKSKKLTAGPNIVMLYADDLGFADVGFNNAKHVETPHIDALSQDGLRFDSLYAGCGVCTPSRVALLTGRFPMRFNIPFAFLSNDGVYMKADYWTLPKILKKSGYSTCHIGKWHLGGIASEEEFESRVAGSQISDGPKEHGFDDVLVMNENQSLRTHLAYVGGIYNGGTRYLYRNDVRLEPFYGHWTSYKGEAAVDYIEQHTSDEKPFFLNVCFDVPHTPIEAAPEPFMSRYAQRRYTPDDERNEKCQQYCSMVAHLDHQVGRIVKALKEQNIYENTIIFFSSDNGATRSEIKMSNLPLRDGKWSLYNGGIVVPSFVVWKGHISSGIKTNETCHQVDLLPTFCDLVGVPLPKHVKIPFDGISLKESWLVRKKMPERTFFYTSLQNHVVIKGAWKLCYSRNSKVSRYELYNITVDKSETNNLIGKHPEKGLELRKALLAYIKQPRERATARPEYNQPVEWNKFMTDANKKAPAIQLPVEL